MRYEIRIPGTHDYRQGQSDGAMLLQKAGVSHTDYRWIMAQTCAYGYNHHWLVKCDKEQLSVLVLSGATIIRNLTEQYRESGPAKLTDDEKEALGLA